MKPRKIFVEIGVPPYLRKRLAQKISQWKHFPIKWTKESNLHITLAFIGYVDESVLPEICQSIRQTVEKFQSFGIIFDRIEFGPNSKNPKLIQLSGLPSEQLGKLNMEIEKALGMQPQLHREYRPHITLGRIRKIKWDKLKEKPIIEEKVNVGMDIESISVMESMGDDSEYVSVEECPLA